MFSPIKLSPWLETWYLPAFFFYFLWSFSSLLSLPLGLSPWFFSLPFPLDNPLDFLMSCSLTVFLISSCSKSSPPYKDFIWKDFITFLSRNHFFLGFSYMSDSCILYIALHLFYFIFISPLLKKSCSSFHDIPLSCVIIDSLIYTLCVFEKHT